METFEMGRRTFYILDVFAEEKYTGNQLAVFTDVKGLPGAEMQQIAREMNYSETTFILSKKERAGGYDVRIFTPKVEVPFAGHPTLGTAYVIQREIIGKPIEMVILNLKVGQIPVSFNYVNGRLDALWMKQIEPSFGRVFNKAQLAEALNLHAEDVDDRFPVQEVSTGVPFIVAPLRTLDAVKRAKTAKDQYSRLIRNAEAKAILIFASETYNRGNNLNVRVFAEYHGVPEDPATGSANGCLAGYLVRHRYFGTAHLDIRVEQGYEIGRPSLLFLRAEKRAGKIDVRVGGKVVMVATGEFL